MRYNIRRGNRKVFPIVIWVFFIGVVVFCIYTAVDHLLNDSASKALHLLRSDVSNAESITIEAIEGRFGYVDVTKNKNKLASLIDKGRVMQYEHDTVIWQGRLVVTSTHQQKVYRLSVVARMPHALIIDREAPDTDLLVPNGFELVSNPRATPR